MERRGWAFGIFFQYHLIDTKKNVILNFVIQANITDLILIIQSIYL